VFSCCHSRCSSCSLPASLRGSIRQRCIPSPLSCPMSGAVPPRGHAQRALRNRGLGCCSALAPRPRIFANVEPGLRSSLAPRAVRRPVRVLAAHTTSFPRPLSDHHAPDSRARRGVWSHPTAGRLARPDRACGRRAVRHRRGGLVPGASHEEWRSAVAYVLRDASTADGIVFCAPFTRPASEYYALRGDPKSRPIPVSPATRWALGAERQTSCAGGSLATAYRSDLGDAGIRRPNIDCAALQPHVVDEGAVAFARRSLPGRASAALRRDDVTGSLPKAKRCTHNVRHGARSLALPTQCLAAQLRGWLIRKPTHLFIHRRTRARVP
jgi:hypothetical protein